MKIPAFDLQRVDMPIRLEEVFRSDGCRRIFTRIGRTGRSARELIIAAGRRAEVSRKIGTERGQQIEIIAWPHVAFVVLFHRLAQLFLRQEVREEYRQVSALAFPSPL